MDFATLVDTIASIIDFSNAIKRKFTEGRDYRRQRFGSIRGELYYWLGILNTEQVQAFHYNINLWTKDEACRWKEAFVSRCSAISVAAAIFASIGQAALGLDGMTDAHWSASALLTASMGLGILSVCAAVTLQNSVTGLSNHREIRLWLSKGLSKSYIYREPYDNLLLESSSATVKLIDVPQLLLNLSITAYFLGFGLYLLYGWMWAIIEPATNFRNNFIFYVCIIGAVIGYVAFLWAGKIVDKDKVNQQFNVKRRFDTGTTDKRMEMLERWSDVVEVLTSSKDESEREEARRAMNDVLYFMRHGEKPTDQQEKPKAESTSFGSDVTAVKEKPATNP